MLTMGLSGQRFLSKGDGEEEVFPSDGCGCGWISKAVQIRVDKKSMFQVETFLSMVPQLRNF